MREPPTLRVDPISCDGHGLCAELFPERVSLDDQLAWLDGLFRVPTLFHHLVVNSGRQHCNQMHSCRDANYLEHISHVAPDGSYQCISSLRVEHSHPTDMASEMSFADKIGQDYLIESR